MTRNKEIGAPNCSCRNAVMEDSVGDMEEARSTQEMCTKRDEAAEQALYEDRTRKKKKGRVSMGLKGLANKKKAPIKKSDMRPNKIRCLETKKDKISCLPSDIIGQILSLLPIREAMKTSILSREWRDKWPHLVEVSIHNLDVKKVESYQGTSSESLSNLLKFVAQLPHVRRLKVEDNFLKYLAIRTLPRKLPIQCVDPSYLSIWINFENSKKIAAALSLLRSSPNLQELHITLMTGTIVRTQPYCWEGDDWSCLVKQLRFVTIDGTYGRKVELDFIRLLLIHSPVLERMTVKLVGSTKIELMEELFRIERAWGKDEIICVEYDL